MLISLFDIFDKPLAAKAPEREQYHHRSEGKKADIFRIIFVIITRQSQLFF